VMISRGLRAATATAALVFMNGYPRGLGIEARRFKALP
jgi:hypothetical protein